MDEDGRYAAEDPAPRGIQSWVGLYLHGCCLQPRANAESADTGSSARISRGRGVPKIAKWRSWAPSMTYENAIWSGFPTGTKLKT